MRTFARLVDDRVVELLQAEGSIEGRFHPSLVWQEVTGAAPALGHLWTGADFVPPPGRPVAELRDELRAAVDGAAERCRSQWLTPGAGQAMVYLRKADEARALVAGGPGPFPLLAASVGIEGEDQAAVAALVIAREAAWVQIGAQIEALRLAAKVAIEQAEDEVAARAAAAVDWPTPEE